MSEHRVLLPTCCVSDEHWNFLLSLPQWVRDHEALLTVLDQHRGKPVNDLLRAQIEGDLRARGRTA